MAFVTEVSAFLHLTPLPKINGIYRRRVIVEVVQCVFLGETRGKMSKENSRGIIGK